jgi:cytochrome c1
MIRSRSARRRPRVGAALEQTSLSRNRLGEVCSRVKHLAHSLIAKAVPTLAASALAVTSLAGAGVLTACAPSPAAPRWSNFGGDPSRGALLVGRYSCGACHEIPGVEDANGLVGPPLAAFSRRTMIAGLLPNTPPNLVHWLRHPQAVTPGNAMPDLGITDAQARDIAAYLYKTS